MLYWIFKIIGFPLFKLYHRAERVGLENVPEKGALIVVANHASFLDPWYLGVMFRARHIHYMVTREWYKSIFWKLFFYLCGCFPVTPDKMDLQSIKRCMVLLKKGCIVGIFPEGGICYDGKMQTFKHGAVHIAQKTEVPILPVAICGSYQAYPRTKKFPRPKKIKIIIGKPIRISRGDAASRDDLAMKTEEIRTWINDQLENFLNNA